MGLDVDTLLHDARISQRVATVNGYKYRMDLVRRYMRRSLYSLHLQIFFLGYHKFQ